MFSRSACIARPLLAGASRTLGTAVLRAPLHVVRPALTSSLHTSSRVGLQKTSSLASEAGASESANPLPEPKNLHEHPRIWEDVNLPTLGNLLTSREVSADGPKLETDIALLDFYADWCGPCKALSPLLQEVAKDEAKNTTVISLDVDKHPEIAQEFQITSLPTVYGLYQNRPVRQCMCLSVHPS